MHGDETPDAYLNRAQEYADALAAIGEHVKDKDLVMLVVSVLRKEYNGLKTTITARQTFYGAHPSNNNRSNNNNNCGNRNKSCGNNNRVRDNGRQFDWASTQNIVYGTCNRCGIGHIASQCPNRDPSTIRTRPSANFANTHDQSSNASTNWHSDTGAKSHMTFDLEAMDNSEAYYGDDALHVGNGKDLPILHIGSSKVYSPQKMFSFKNILHLPEISHNLLSVQNFCHDNDVFFEFHTSYFFVKDESTHTTLLTGPSKHGLYTITLPQLKSINKVSFSVVRASPTIWHRRLGYPHQRLLHSVLSNFSLPDTNKSLSSFCNSCPLGKSSKLPLFESGFRSNNILDLVYCDVWGPAPLLSFEGHRYFMLCVDHHSRYMWIYHLAQKSDVYSTFKSFVQMVERQFTTKLKNVQTDWGGEFRNLALFFSSLGIIHRRSCPHTSEQNGFVERRNRHVVETGLTLLAQACVPQCFWHYAFDTAVYLINRMPSRTSTNKSPFEHIFKRSPDYSFLHVFGCLCFPHLRPYNRHKMDFRSTPCVFLGYSPSHYGYRCLDISTERQPSPVSATSIPTPPPPPPPITWQRPVNLRQNPKQRVPYNPFANHATVLPTTITEPASFTVANNSSEWRQAMKEEYDALMKNGTWSLVPRASTTNVVDDDIIVTEIVPHVFGILLFQKKYILELLQSAGLSNCNPVSSPMVTSSSLSLDDSTVLSNLVKYQQVVGSLQYVTLSRPDIAFAVNKVCQYMHAPTENHWYVVKWILRYLHGMVEHGMLIRRSSGSTLQAFTDVLWKGNPDTSLEAFLDADWAIYLGSNLISWTARKQRTVSRSSTEAEYKALADTVAELTWLQALLHELGIRSSSTPILWCDNLGATYLSANPIFRARTKHVEIDYHFVREKVAQGDLRVQHISTHDQIADIFTKPLPTPRFLFLRSKL
ncbi:putative RNA-directed DNA polymerase [Tanacetum coccineum]